MVVAPEYVLLPEPKINVPKLPAVLALTVLELAPPVMAPESVSDSPELATLKLNVLLAVLSKLIADETVILVPLLLLSNNVPPFLIVILPVPVETPP